MSKPHSPAPWTLLTKPSPRGGATLPVEIHAADGADVIAFAPRYQYGPSSDANAALIAAAPELLAALVAISGAYASNGNTKRQREAFATVRAAIAKAAGAQS